MDSEYIKKSYAFKSTMFTMAKINKEIGWLEEEDVIKCSSIRWNGFNYLVQAQ